ncbi:MAG: protein phosphatase 2C domain-containing protein [Cyanobacteria bacterium P01_H01_bin.121]
MSSTEPLLNPYLWAIGSPASQVEPGGVVGDRYRIIAPQVWLDTKPGIPPQTPTQLPQELLPYQYLYPYRLHLPIVYGICVLQAGTVVLLENVPIEGAGSLLPNLEEGLKHASPARQVYWLWQMLQLWKVLGDLSLTASLLQGENLRVEGWRLRLLELYAGDGLDDPLGSRLDDDPERYADSELAQPNLTDLGRFWHALLPLLQPEAQIAMTAICQQLLEQSDPSWSAIATPLNQLLLALAAQKPLKLKTVGLLDPGREPEHNEDLCYPLPNDLRNRGVPPDSQLIPSLAMVCDGLGGHEGGEVASQLAIRSLKLQIQTLLSELSTQNELLLPDQIMDQLAAGIRVVNNLIATQNDLQQRQALRRMATTLTLALHLRQPLPTGQKSHEIYLASIGDSRAYWITPHYCQPLTVDDDVACRETRLGRSLYREALQRPDAGSLTQALGNRGGEELFINLQRLTVDEDGLLLLCSDGLSDYGWVERSWAELAPPLIKGSQSVEATVQAWVELAKQKNGHDNIAIVLMRCQVSPDYPVAMPPAMTPQVQPEALQPPVFASTPELQPLEPSPINLSPTDGSGPVTPEPEADLAPTENAFPWGLIFKIAGVILLSGLIGFIVVRQLTAPELAPPIDAPVESEVIEEEVIEPDPN